MLKTIFLYTMDAHQVRHIFDLFPFGFHWLATNTESNLKRMNKKESKLAGYFFIFHVHAIIGNELTKENKNCMYFYTQTESNDSWAGTWTKNG